MKLQLQDNQLDLIQDKKITLSQRELFVNALANIDYIQTLIEQCLYNPQRLFFATQSLKYDNNITIYTDNQEKTYNKFENISKIIIVNVIIKSYDIIFKNIYNCYIPSSFFAPEFEQLDINSYSLSMANKIIYTTAILNLFEQQFVKRNKKAEYRNTIKKVLQIFCDYNNWQDVADDYIQEEFAIPIRKHLYLLLKFYQR